MIRYRYLYFFIFLFFINSDAQNSLSNDWQKFKSSFISEGKREQLKNANNYPEIIPPYNMSSYNKEIEHIYKTVLDNDSDNINNRIIQISQFFLGKKYLLGALGEGPQGEFDQQPLYRTDAFDCTTYVETVLALSHGKNLQQFQTEIKKIRYGNDRIAHTDRNHFTSVDWNIQNQKKGYIQDITDRFSIPYKTTNTLIDKPNWYRKLPASAIQLLRPIDPQQTQLLINKFRRNAKDVKATVSQVKYLPLSELFFYKNGQLFYNDDVFDAIPSPAIIEIVRENYNLTKVIGTNLDVTHMGFAIRTPQGLMFREASEIKGRVTDIPLVNYLASYYQYVRHPEHVGINIQRILNKDSV